MAVFILWERVFLVLCGEMCEAALKGHDCGCAISSYKHLQVLCNQFLFSAEKKKSGENCENLLLSANAIR